MTGPFTAAPHHDVLLLLIQLAVLLFTARLFGELAGRLGQPSVVGELLAGIVLGPSLLSGFVPALGTYLVPHTEVQGYLLEVVSLLGALFLLLITGLETDLSLVRRHARTAAGVSFGGILVTFSSGFLLGQFLPDVLLSDPERRLTFALFVGTAMSISAIPVIAKVMLDLGLMRRDIGQTILAAGMSDDTVGWILLSVVAGLASGEEVTVGSVGSAVGRVLAFLLISFTLGRWLVRRSLAFVQERSTSPDAVLSLVLVLTFAWGALTQALELEAVLGAFIMGILFGGMRRLRTETRHKIESVGLSIFAPIFFGVAGLKVNVLGLLQPGLLAIAGLVIFVATAGKVVGTYLGARLVGKRDHWTALSFGAGLNARGAMEIIIATIGLQLGILSQNMFSIIVLMAMATSLMAPSALRFVLARVTPSEEETARLRREALAAGSLVSSIHRVLIPVRPRAAQTDDAAVRAVESRLLSGLGSDLAVTLLTVTPPGERAANARFLDDYAKGFSHRVSKRIVERESVADAILDEAYKEYDLLLLGAPSGEGSREVVFNPLVDYVVRSAPCPTIVVKGAPEGEAWLPNRILLPVNGSLAARRAAEVAFALAQRQHARVTLLNVVERPLRSTRLLNANSDTATERQLDHAHRVVEELRTLAASYGVEADTDVRLGRNPSEVILGRSERGGFDLVVLGTDLRTGSERLFLGPRVEKILDGATCPVVIVNTGFEARTKGTKPISAAKGAQAV